MTVPQLTVVAILVAAMAMFIWGRWRHDMVSMGALLLCVLAGLVPGTHAFAGFGHPAVITVVSVLILGHGLQISGAVDTLAHRLLPTQAGPSLSILALVGMGALLSSFINNVGALAMLMPIAIQMAARHKLPAGQVLMPLAFGSILGGMTTLIGTPTNLIVSGFRETIGPGAYAMFDFTPVGVGVAVLGVVFAGLIGWRLVPARKQADAGGFESGAYFSELRIVEGSKAADKRLRDVEKMLDDLDAQIVALVRSEVRLSSPYSGRMLRAGDILVVEVEPETLSRVMSKLGLELAEAMPAVPAEDDDGDKADDTSSAPGAVGAGHEDNAESNPDDAPTAAPKPDGEEMVLREMVVTPTGALVNRSATDIELRTGFGVNLLAISRQGKRSLKRLRSTPLQAGDLLLLQGPAESLARFASQFGCLPLVAREIRVHKPGLALKAALIMAVAVGAAALGLLPSAVAFTAGAVAFVAMGVVPVRSVYNAVDWPVIVLLGAMLPVAEAMATTGAADLIARVLLQSLAQGHAVAALAVVLVVTIVLSNVMNNAATAAVMCPIGVSTAHQIGASPDTFLMAIAVGASAAFMTPIGHQNNTLILGPGGFRFGDYWRLGLALTILVLAVSIPLLLLIWPL